MPGYLAGIALRPLAEAHSGSTEVRVACSAAAKENCAAIGTRSAPSQIDRVAVDARLDFLLAVVGPVMVEADGAHDLRLLQLAIGDAVLELLGGGLGGDLLAQPQIGDGLVFAIVGAPLRRCRRRRNAVP